MGYEVDFLAVGDESKSGDAIALRFGNLDGLRNEQTVVVIDGGYKASGADLVKHIKDNYGTGVVDLVVSTHPDSDHTSGLLTVLEEIEVKKVWMHKPWERGKGKAIQFEDGRITDKSIGDRLKNSLETAYKLCKIANEKKIPIEEPFRGLRDKTGNIEVVGPTSAYYDELILEFTGMPQKNRESASNISFESLKEKVLNLVSDFWDRDLIKDDGETTSAQNNSSAIIQITVDGKRLLFTGDAGRESLGQAADYIGSSSGLAFIQIPHHGSARNIGPSVLNKLVGGIKAKKHVPHFSAFCSSAKNGAPKHPSKKVLNAFIRRGAKVHVTAGAGKNHNYNSPSRVGWSSATPEAFQDKVEA